MSREKSSFLKQSLSKEDAIIQFLRPQLNNKVSQTLDIFERLVNEAETLVTLGIMLQPGGNNGQRYQVTAAELKANLDEFPELQQIAEKGRALLSELEYVPRRKQTPLPGSAPVGQSVSVLPIISQLPGNEELQGGIVNPVKSPKNLK